MTENIQNSKAIIDSQFKDQTPEATVRRIQAILAENGIAVEEEWRPTSVPYCYAMSVKVVGTTFQTNGKGLTRDFARASGYAELMERLQLGFICSPQSQKEDEHRIPLKNQKEFTARELLDSNRKWYEQISRRIDEFHAPAATAEQILADLAGPTGKIAAVPFFSLCSGSEGYFPTALFQRVYASNGCASGNTPEEAIVQAISEAVERCHTLRVINENLSLPDVPEEELEKYPVSLSIIRYIRDKGYRLLVKDCSLGEKFPVVCIVILDPRTGRYYTHIGASPVFEIALERALTESFQGRTIDRIATHENLQYRTEKGFQFASICTEFMIGGWEKTPAFFVGQPKYPYNPRAGFTGTNNRELLRQCLDYFQEQDLDVLVRDSSCLGFCTYQVLIPGYSEIFLNRVCQSGSDMRYRSYAVKTLRDPITAAMPDMLGYLMHLDQRKQYGSKASQKYNFTTDAKLPIPISPAENEFLTNAVQGYVFWSLGRPADALKCAQAMARFCEPEAAEPLLALKRMLSMKLSGCDRERIADTLRYFHTEGTAAWLLESSENPFGRFVLRCGPDKCGACRFRDRCCQQRVDQISALIRDKVNELRFDDFAREMRQLLA